MIISKPLRNKWHYFSCYQNKKWNFKTRDNYFNQWMMSLLLLSKIIIDKWKWFFKLLPDKWLFSCSHPIKIRIQDKRKLFWLLNDVIFHSIKKFKTTKNNYFQTLTHQMTSFLIPSKLMIKIQDKWEKLF